MRCISIVVIGHNVDCSLLVEGTYYGLSSKSSYIHSWSDRATERKYGLRCIRCLRSLGTSCEPTEINLDRQQCATAQTTSRSKHLKQARQLLCKQRIISLPRWTDRKHEPVQRLQLNSNTISYNSAQEGDWIKACSVHDRDGAR